MKTNLQKFKMLFLIIGICMVYGNSLLAQPLELQPIEAGFAWERYPDSANFNETAVWGDMPVQLSPDDNDSRETYIQFDLSQVKEVVTSVSLKVTAGQKEGLDEKFTDKEYVVVDDFYVEIYACNNKNNNWTQDELTWNSKLAADKFFMDTINVPPTGSVSFELNNDRIVDYVQGMVGAGKTSITFIFKARDPYTHSRAWITNGAGMESKTPTLTIESMDMDATALAVKDVFINQAEPDTNYNEKTDMGILNALGKSRHAYVSFLKEELPDFADDVYLQVFGTQKQGTDGIDGSEYKGQPEFVVEVHGVHDHNSGNSWDETTLTWNSSQPATTLVPLAEIVFQANNKPLAYYANSEAMTNFYNRRMAHTGSTNISFVLKAKHVSDSSRAWISENDWKPAKLMASGKIRGASVGVDDNVYVDEALPFTNFDASGDMHVALANGKHRIVYGKFDLTGLAQADEIVYSITGGQQGSGYMLKDSFMVEVYACEDKSWTEEALVWQSRPALTGDALAMVNMLSGPKQVAHSDAFTAYINNAINTGDTSVTLALKAKYETFTASDSIRAWIWAGGSALDLFYVISQDIGAPVFDPGPGVKTENFSVTLTTTTEGGKIYYTLDGSVPTSSSNLYTAPIQLTSDMGNVRIRAITILDGARSEESSGDFLVGIQEPYDGTPLEFPAILYTNKFDIGGPTVSYYTTNTSFPNWSNLQDCRSDNAGIVGLADDCNLETGGVSAPSENQWMEYTVLIPSDITCYKANVFYRKAEEENGQDPASLRIQIMGDNDKVLKTLIDSADFAPNIPAWEYDGEGDPKLIDEKFAIPAGEQVMRLTILGDDWNIERIEFIPSTGCVISVDEHYVNGKKVKLYPNPVLNGFVNVDLSGWDTDEVKVTLFDITGKVWCEHVINSDKGNIPLDDIADGVYLMKFESSKGVITERIFIQ